MALEACLVVVFSTFLVVYGRLQGGVDLEVDTPLGKVKGLDYTTPNGCKLKVFESVPYAEPPNRFEKLDQCRS